MREITVNKFRASLKNCADQAIFDHELLRVMLCALPPLRSLSFGMAV